MKKLFFTFCFFFLSFFNGASLSIQKNSYEGLIEESILNQSITPIPTGEPIQSFCDSATVGDLSMDPGGTITWFDSATGGKELDSTDALVDGDLVFAEQSLGGVTSVGRFQVLVHIFSISTVYLEICQGESIEISSREFAPNIPNSFFLGAFNEFFYYYNNLYLGFDEAESYSQIYGGHLASIHSEEENTFIRDQSPAGVYSTIGLRDNIIFDNYYWTDNSPYDYFNWGSNEPSPSPGEDYVQITNVGTWLDRSSLFTSPSNIKIPNTSFSLTWSNGESTDSIIVAPTALSTYTLTIELNGLTCQRDYIVVVNSPPTKIDNSTGATELTCDETSISLTATGGVIYSWSDGASVVSSTADLNVTTPGTYTVTVTGANGCIDTTDIVITQNTTLPTPGITNNTGATELTCDETSISLTATGGVTYSWSDGITTVSSTADLNITIPGTYTVTVTGANGCIDTTNIVITQNINLPTPGITNNTGATELTCALTSISLTAKGGVTYSWSDGASTVSSTADLNITTPGTYTVTVTDVNGCSDTTDIVITQDITLIPGITNNTGATELTCALTSISLTATGGVTYSWSDGITTVSSTADLNITIPGTYTVTVTGANGCIDTTDIVITQNINLPTPGITNNTGATELTCDETSISLTATGGVIYSWSDGASLVSSTADLNVTTPGTYTVTVTDANGCSDTTNIVITQNTTLPTPGITNNTGATELSCDITTIGLTATGGVSYSWSDGTTTVSSTADLNITTPGTYTVTVTGANGCSDTTNIVITQNITLPTIGITNNTGATELTCDETSISLTAKGGVTYSWSDGASTVSSTADLNITKPGTYTVTVTDVNGCSDTTNIVITQDITLIPGITNNTGATELTCALTSISLTATGGVTYSWSDGITTVSSTADLNITIPGTYTVTVTGANGCSDTTDVVITQNTTLPTPGITNNTGATELTCDITTISLTATGGVIYSWSDGASVVSSTADLNVTTPGTYTVTVTDANGCSDTTDIVITQNTTLPTIGITNNTGATELTCALTSISLTATGGVTYSWSDGITTVSSTADLNITIPGTYTVTVTGANGCSDTTDIVITQNTTLPTPGITNNTGATELTCDITTISLTATGGVIYSWSDGASVVSSTADLNVTTPGTYTVTVTDANGCSDTTDIVITQNTTLPTPGITNNTGATELSCDITTIGLTATGGVSYSWSDGTTTVSSTADLNITTPGTYTVTVTGANGCIDTTNIVITQNITLPTIGITNNTGATELTCDETSISLTAKGGVTYSWSDGASVVSSTADLNVTKPGTYTVTVTGANGCSDTTDIVITQNTTLPTPGITNNTGATELTCALTSISLTATGGVTYSWSHGSSMVSSIADLNITTPGTFTVTVTGANGCSDTTDVVITQNTTLPIPGITNNTGATELTCALTSISLTATGGVTYSWSDGASTVSSTADLNITKPGTYTVTLTGANGCSDTTDIVITQDITLIPGITNNTGATELTCDETSISLTATGGFTYSWSDGITTVSSTADLNVTTPGTYTVTVTGVNGCSDTTDIVITQNTTLPTPGITNNTGATELTCDITTISLTATGGVIYSWSEGASLVSSTADLNVTTIGTYTVTVTGANGCSDTESRTITDDIALPTAGIMNNTLSTELTCSLTSINITATGGGTYVWNTGDTTPDLNITVPGTYTVKVTSSNGCTDTESIIITEDIGPNSPISEGDQIGCEFTILTASAKVFPGEIITWYDAAIGGNIVADPFLNSVGSVTYYAEAINVSTNCSSLIRTAVTLSIVSEPDAPMGDGIQVFCDIPTIGDLLVVGDNIKWYDSAIDGNQLNATLQLTNGQTVYASQTISGCESNDRISVNVVFDLKITPIFTQVDPICFGDTLLTLPTISINGYSGVWSPILDNTVTTTYTFTPDIGQCATNSTMTIEVYPRPQTPNGMTEQYFCAINSPMISDLILNTSFLNWYLTPNGGQSLSQNYLLTDGLNLFASSYDALTFCESSSRFKVEISVENPLLPDVDTEISFCKELNPIIDFIDTNGITMNWYDSSVGGELLTSEYILENGETLYAATFNTASGCESIDRLEFNIEIIDSDLEYYNAITIDSNNINDALRIIGIENFPLNTIEIYNRYGTLVWKNSNYNNKTVVFNGIANVSGVVSRDSFLPSGTYFFVLKYPNYCKQTQLKGFINIDNKN